MVDQPSCCTSKPRVDPCSAMLMPAMTSLWRIVFGTASSLKHDGTGALSTLCMVVLPSAWPGKQVVCYQCCASPLGLQGGEASRVPPAPCLAAGPTACGSKSCAASAVFHCGPQLVNIQLMVASGVPPVLCLAAGPTGVNLRNTAHSWCALHEIRVLLGSLQLGSFKSSTPAARTALLNTPTASRWP